MSSETPQTKISTITADGVEVFYRSAGSPSVKVILLLHGFPSSSHMFRNLIPILATQYRVIAPDLPGFGFTVVPPERKYEYTFTNLTHTIQAFLDTLNIQKFAVYIFDYGAPVALRLALNRPQAITAIVTQNGNAYEEGLGKEFWAPLREYWASDSHEDREKLRSAALNFETTKWQYVFGSPHPDAIPPESYHLDSALLTRSGNQDIQLDLFRDYKNNVVLYDRFHDYLETSGVPVLVAWGKNDPIFVAAGAEAYKKHAKDVEIHFLDAGHFALETNELEVSKLMIGFFNKLSI
jgi:pimeloyl-ACP methyl ester carboxylesterase